MTMEKFMDRAAGLIGAYGNYGVTPDQVDAETVAMARCALIKQSMELFIKFVYQRDGNGFLHNLSGNSVIPTGIHTPWASAGKPRKAKERRPQLSKDERAVVRAWLAWLKQNRRFPLFIYNRPSRRWIVDTMRYETEAAALAWLTQNTLDAKNYIAIKGHLGA